MSALLPALLLATTPATIAEAEKLAAQALHVAASQPAQAVTLSRRALDITVNDGAAGSNVAHSLITVSANTAPVAQDDDASATEAGGTANAVAGSSPKRSMRSLCSVCEFK